MGNYWPLTTVSVCSQHHSDFQLLSYWDRSFTLSLSSFSFVQTPQMSASVWLGADHSNMVSYFGHVYVSHLFPVSGTVKNMKEKPTEKVCPTKSHLYVNLRGLSGWKLMDAADCLVQLWDPHCTLMAQSERCSVEMGFVEHESIRNRTVMAGSLCTGRLWCCCREMKEERWKVHHVFSSILKCVLGNSKITNSILEKSYFCLVKGIKYRI